MSSPDPAGALARRLRELREDHWPDRRLTQSDLATAFSGEAPIGPAAISSWESAAHPRVPPKHRLRAYARFFATDRSVAEERLVLLRSDELSEEEIGRRDALDAELAMLAALGRGVGEPDDPDEPEPAIGPRRSWQFDAGPITIVCPELPLEARSPLADPRNPNHTAALAFADTDALLQLYGDLRALNPGLDVDFMGSGALGPRELQGHLVLLGGMAWNETSRRFLSFLDDRLPVRQVEIPGLETGEVFQVDVAGETRTFGPTFQGDELIEDVALLARMPNPYNGGRTLSICNGIHSRGVLGAVNTLVDVQLRDANEAFLADRFGEEQRYVLLLRVAVYRGAVMTPDVTDAGNVLYAWPDIGATV